MTVEQRDLVASAVGKCEGNRESHHHSYVFHPNTHNQNPLSSVIILECSVP